MRLDHVVSEYRWNIAAFAWGLAEATLFFIVPDVLLSFVALKRGARAGAVASVFAALGAGAGGALMYLWSAANADAARAAVLAVPAINERMAEAAAHSIAARAWFWATLLGPLSTPPYKLYAILAPHAGAPLILFVAASVIARLPRFLIVSAGVALIARWLEPRLGVGRLPWVLAGCWALFYLVYFSLNPG